MALQPPSPDTPASNRWRSAASALADARRLGLYGRIITSAQEGNPLQAADLDRAETKSLAVLHKAGLVSSGPDGLGADPGCFSRLLQEGQRKTDSSPLRFLAPGNAGTLPSKRADRLELLHHLAGEVFSRQGSAFAGSDPAAAKAQLTETEVTSRLGEFTADPAMLRRAMVDEGIVRRSPDGSRYWLAKPRPAGGMDFAAG